MACSFLLPLLSHYEVYCFNITIRSHLTASLSQGGHNLYAVLLAGSWFIFGIRSASRMYWKRLSCCGTSGNTTAPAARIKRCLSAAIPVTSRHLTCSQNGKALGLVSFL